MFKLNVQGAGRVKLDYTFFIEKIKNGEVAKVKIENRNFIWEI
jgi:predicted RNA-binding protein with TRAM domain